MQIFNLNSMLPYIEKSKNDIIKDWVKSEFTTIVLIKLNMSKDDFIKLYANDIFDTIIKNFQDIDSMQECPYMTKFLEVLGKENIGINEAVLVCMDLRKVFYEFTYVICGGYGNKYEIFKKIFDEMFLKLNQQLAGLIKSYNKIVNVQQDEQKYQKLLQEYKKAVDFSSIVSKTDTKGIITFANEAFCKISGYTQDELIGKSHNLVRHQDMPKSAFEHMWHTIQAKKIWKGVVKNKAKNGSTYIVDATIVPILDDNDNIIEYIGLRHDITELMATKEEVAHKSIEIKESVDKAYSIKLDSLVKVIPVPAVIINNENIIVLSNDKFANIFDMFEKAELLKQLEEKMLTLSSIFIKDDSCLQHDELFDFKNTLLEADTIEVIRVKIDTGDGLRYFNINIQDLSKFDDFDDFDNKYLVTLS